MGFLSRIRNRTILTNRCHIRECWSLEGIEWYEKQEKEAPVVSSHSEKRVTRTHSTPCLSFSQQLTGENVDIIAEPEPASQQSHGSCLCIGSFCSHFTFSSYTSCCFWVISTTTDFMGHSVKRLIDWCLATYSVFNEVTHADSTRQQVNEKSFYY